MGTKLHLIVNKSGSLSLPAALLRKIGWQAGDEIEIYIDEEKLCLRRVGDMDHEEVHLWMSSQWETVHGRWMDAETLLNALHVDLKDP